MDETNKEKNAANESVADECPHCKAEREKREKAEREKAEQERAERERAEQVIAEQEKATKCCCQAEKSERTAEEHAERSCCNEQPKKSCCAHEQISEKSCCESKEHAEKSCCAQPSQHMDNCCGKEHTERSCCKHEEQTEKDCCTSKDHHSCCESNEHAEKSCCTEPSQHMDNCCGKEHTERSCCEHEEHSSCCGGGATAGCCGSGGKKTGNSMMRDLVFIAMSLAALIVSISLSYSHAYHRVPMLRYFDFAWIAIILCGTPIVVNAVRSLAKGKITSSLLISTSMAACIILEFLTLFGVLAGDGHGHSNLFAAGEVAWLMAVGEILEDYTVGKARSGLSRLMTLAPTMAKYRTAGGDIIEKPLEDVRVGDTVVVLSGDKVSVDGIIVSGSTTVDQSVMTGESVPVDKSVGDAVFGGTLNQGGVIEVQVTKSRVDMAIEKLKTLVLEAEGKKAPISKLADRWASYIVPSAIVLAFLVFIITFFALTNRNISEAVERGITVLVVFCPCSLALATPTAVAAGLGNSTKRGILVKSGAYLEEMSKVTVFAFDKTGTLTEGKLQVDEAVSFGIDEATLKRLAGSAERYSTHPIALAIVAYAGSPLAEPQNCRALTGVGVSADVDGKTVLISKWVDKDTQSDLTAEPSQCAKSVVSADGESASQVAARMLANGKTVVTVELNGATVGLIALSDTIRDSAAEAVQALSALGVKTYMLTGDNEAAAKSIADKLGLSGYHAGLLPENKLELLSQIQSGGDKVCMVGDGVNDAPGLACADCFIAMGALGSDVAIETAGASLMTNDLTKIPSLFALCRAVLKRIKINIAIAMLVNLVAVLLSLFGVLSPIWGALIHNCSSVAVVCSSALLLRKK